MIAVDTNILVYAHRLDSSFHLQARAAIASLQTSGESWAVPWHCLHEFVATVTHTRLGPTTTPTNVALAQVAELLRNPDLVLLTEGPGYIRHLEEIVAGTDIRGGAIHDAHIAAVCLFHGVAELWTADRDFDRFPQLRTRNPLPDFA